MRLRNTPPEPKTLLSLPIELLIQILDYLRPKPKDLLRLRRVCKALSSLVFAPKLWAVVETDEIPEPTRRDRWGQWEKPWTDEYVLFEIGPRALSSIFKGVADAAKASGVRGVREAVMSWKHLSGIRWPNPYYVDNGERDRISRKLVGIMSALFANAPSLEYVSLEIERFAQLPFLGKSLGKTPCPNLKTLKLAVSVEESSVPDFEHPILHSELSTWRTTMLALSRTLPNLESLEITVNHGTHYFEASRFDEDVLEGFGNDNPFADEDYAAGPFMCLSGTRFANLTELVLDGPEGRCWWTVQPGPLARACPKLKTLKVFRPFEMQLENGDLKLAGFEFTRLLALLGGCTDLESVDLFFGRTIEVDWLGGRLSALLRRLVELPSAKCLKELILRLKEVDGAGWHGYHREGKSPALNRYAARWKERKAEGKARGEDGWASWLKLEIHNYAATHEDYLWASAASY